MTDMEALKTAGACGFTDDGIPLKKRRVFIRGNGKIQTAKRTDQPS